jgi:long-subunit acyl-CoA synthetase (AMP-forming)
MFKTLEESMPQLIENTMKQSRFIEQIMVIEKAKKCRLLFNLIWIP